MNKLQTIVLFIVIFGLCACENFLEKNCNPFATINIHITSPLVDDPNAPTCEITIVIDSLTDTTHSASLINDIILQEAFNLIEQSFQATADTFCARYITRYKSTLADIYAADKRANLNSDWYNYRFSLSSSHNDGLAGILCYTIQKRRYEGGAREYGEIRSLNFDKTTGTLVTLDDLFIAAARTELPPLILQALLKKYNCAEINRLHDKNILRLTDIYIPKNYIFGSDSLTFIYNVDEIAPYQTGVVTVSLSYPSLGSLMKTAVH